MIHVFRKHSSVIQCCLSLAREFFALRIVFIAHYGFQRPLTRGSGPRWELRPQTPVIGSRSAVAMCVHPTFLIWRRPWLSMRKAYITIAIRLRYDYDEKLTCSSFASVELEAGAYDTS